jgi:hypothetical protein
MNKIEAINELKRRAEVIQALGATSLYLFGSVVLPSDQYLPTIGV